MSKNILVVAAHPDDEILGIGGTLIKHHDQGDKVYCLILGQGIMSRKGASEKELEDLHKHSLSASSIIGFEKIFFSNFPDNSFDTVSLLSIAQEVEKYLAKIKPDVVYTHFENDLNIDHRLSFQAVITASRPCNDDSPKEIYSYETLSATEWQNKGSKIFSPNCYVDISNVMDRKIKAMAEYKNEVRKHPHSRSLEGIKILAQYRGLESGLEFAEALCLVRKIDR